MGTQNDARGFFLQNVNWEAPVVSQEVRRLAEAYREETGRQISDQAMSYYWYKLKDSDKPKQASTQKSKKKKAITRRKQKRKSAVASAKFTDMPSDEELDKEIKETEQRLHALEEKLQALEEVKRERAALAAKWARLR